MVKVVPAMHGIIRTLLVESHEFFFVLFFA